jgi:hypothetical protein
METRNHVDRRQAKKVMGILRKTNGALAWPCQRLLLSLQSSRFELPPHHFSVTKQYLGVGVHREDLR